MTKPQKNKKSFDKTPPIFDFSIKRRLNRKNEKNDIKQPVN
jgi:hypothetical protein